MFINLQTKFIIENVLHSLATPNCSQVPLSPSSFNFQAPCTVLPILMIAERASSMPSLISISAHYVLDILAQNGPQNTQLRY